MLTEGRQSVQERQTTSEEELWRPWLVFRVLVALLGRGDGGAAIMGAQVFP